VLDSDPSWQDMYAERIRQNDADPDGASLIYVHSTSALSIVIELAYYPDSMNRKLYRIVQHYNCSLKDTYMYV
jgi:hypothetical protein